MKLIPLLLLLVWLCVGCGADAPFRPYIKQEVRAHDRIAMDGEYYVKTTLCFTKYSNRFLIDTVYEDGIEKAKKRQKDIALHVLKVLQEANK